MIMFLENLEIHITDKGVQKFTPRERQVLKAIADGAENKHIVKALGIGLGTVLAYNERIYEKLNVSHRGINARAAALSSAYGCGYLISHERVL
jgi:DNA-binding NarL/FixJ family response regulator